MKQNRIFKFAGPGLQHLRMCISKFTAQQNDISNEEFDAELCRDKRKMGHITKWSKWTQKFILSHS